MAFSTVPTVAPGDSWSAAQHNTYLRDNMAALWVGSAAGDLDYYSSATTKTRLPAGPATALLRMAASGLAPEWILGKFMNTWGLATFAPDTDYNGSSFANVAGAVVTLTLSATCTIIVICALQGYINTTTAGRVFQGNITIDGVSKGFSANSGSENPARNQPQMALAMSTGVAAGSRVIRLQAKQDTGAATHVTHGDLLAIAITE